MPPEDIYRFESDSLLSSSARNLFLFGGPNYLAICGEYSNGELGDQVILIFGYGKPGYIATLPESASVDFTLEQSVLSSSYGTLFNQGYYHLGEDGLLPAQVVASPPMISPSPEKLYIPYPDALGSQNIHIRYTQSNGDPPRFAGLRWIGRNIRLDVWDDGTIEVIREGVKAIDDDSNWWISKKVGGEIDAIVMVRDYSND